MKQNTEKTTGEKVANYADAELHKEGESAFILHMSGVLTTDDINEAREHGYNVGNISHYETHTEVRFNAY